MQPDKPYRFNRNFLRRYLEIAPAALAIERSLECEILAGQTFERPILDIGCGDGVFAAILSDDKIDTGIDYDGEEIARARAFERYEELITCPGASIPKPDQSFRTIFSNSVLEHIPDLLPVLKEQARLLAPGGRFYVTIPTDRWERSSIPARTLHALGLAGPADRYQKFYNRFWRHYHAYPEEKWIGMFEEAGFRVVARKIYAPANMTTLLDLMTIVAAPAMVSKKVLGRWIAVPPLRRALSPFLHRVISGPTQAAASGPGGNLVFFAFERAIPNSAQVAERSGLDGPANI